MSPRRWPAPAKINLFLHVIGRRADGYHLLQSVFQFLDLADSLSFTARDDGRIRRVSQLSGVDAEDDLVVRAARALQTYTSCPMGVDIAVDKQIPMGAGLGGGSSNAATTLVALNQLWALDLPPYTLATIGVRLGADVPIFLYGKAAFAEGVGDKLTPISPVEPWYLVIWPACAISTKEIFSHPALTRDTPACKMPHFSGMGEYLAAPWHNDCEPLVSTLYPSVADALEFLGASARMTGTGACVFAPFANQKEAHDRALDAPRQWQCLVSKGLNRSPLLD